MPPPPIHEQLRLFITKEHFILEPSYLDASVLAENLTINRATSVLRRNAASSSSLAQQHPSDRVLLIYGIFGFVRLYSGDYMIAITDRRKVGDFSALSTKQQQQQHDVWQITQVELIPFSPSFTHISLSQKVAEEELVAAIKSVCQAQNQDAFYYSLTWDLTRCMQAQFGADKTAAAYAVPLWQRCDPRFHWNRFLQRRMLDASGQPNRPDDDLSAFILPVISGFIEFTRFDTFTFALLSRRSPGRQGTRYFSRGIDHDGNVSNFVETEQLLITANRVCSHVQVRGSIPVFWAHVANTKYKPELRVYGADAKSTSGDADNDAKKKDDEYAMIDRAEQSRVKRLTQSALKKHLDTLRGHYGPHLILWNLVDKKGGELQLANAFSQQLDELAAEGEAGVQYAHFDFHHECRRMQWHKIRILLDQFANELDQQAWFEMTLSTGEILRRQQSVVRTNCIDCLDRTNVVQSELAKLVLTRQLRACGVFTGAYELDQIPEFYSRFKNIWADHADSMSLSYSGTGALKTDFTRLGKRTRAGLISDGMNSLIRYVKNNYLDGPRQDALDLLLGKYEISPIRSVPPMRDWSATFIVLTAVFLLALVALTVNFWSMLLWNQIGDSEVRNTRLQSMLFWLAVLYVDWQLIQLNGREFVRLPKLVDPYAHPLSRINGGGTGFITSPVTLTAPPRNASAMELPR